MFSIEMLDRIRSAEIDKIASYFVATDRILEIGAGSGHQSAELCRRGLYVTAVDLPNSTYAGKRVFPVMDYDGTTLPFPDASFDAVFTSNVLEHVYDLNAMQAEIKRVLKPGGYCVHVLPTHVWRFWTSVSLYPSALVHIFVAGWCLLIPSAGNQEIPIRQLWRDALQQLLASCVQPRHGEHGNAVGELWRFHPASWRRTFRNGGFEIAHDEPIGLFYTGNLLFGRWWSIEKRSAFARRFGSACHVFKLVLPLSVDPPIKGPAA